MSVSVSEISSTGGLMTAGLETTKVDIIHHLLDTGPHWATLWATHSNTRISIMLWSTPTLALGPAVLHFYQDYIPSNK